MRWARRAGCSGGERAGHGQGPEAEGEFDDLEFVLVKGDSTGEHAAEGSGCDPDGSADVVVGSGGVEDVVEEESGVEGVEEWRVLRRGRGWRGGRGRRGCGLGW